MALYAVDEDHLISAFDAEAGRYYWCLECFLAVKVRRARNRLPHFYHIRTSPQCRLYSKSEDHMRAQLDLKRLFPEGALQIERPFPDICRVADLCWEREKIIFEIQCSKLELLEVESRIADYQSIGYSVAWLLDDRLYNRATLRPSERFLRSRFSYFLSLRRGKEAYVYDQFEVYANERRVKRGKKLYVDLQKSSRHSPPLEGKLPKQILERSANEPRFFSGDRIDLALLGIRNSTFFIYLDNWRFLENHLGQDVGKKNNWLIKWLKEYLLDPYKELLLWLNEH